MGISLKPSDAVPGGLLDDVNVTITQARFVTWDYQGKIPSPQPAIKLTLELEDGEGEDAEQYWSIGTSRDWAPSEDGKSLIAVSQASHLRQGANGVLFLESLVNAGFPEDKLDDDISVLEGTECHMIRQAAPKRPGLATAPKESADGRTFEATVLVVDEILKLPWEAAKGRGKGKGKGKAKTTGAGAKGKGTSKKETPTSVSNDELQEKATLFVMEILEESGGKVAKKELPPKLFNKAKADPDRNALIQLVNSDAFLSNGPWVYDNGIVSNE